MLSRRSPDDRGAGAIEYGAAVMLAAVILGGLYATGLTTTLTAATGQAVCELTGGDCESPEGSGDDPADPADPVDPADPNAPVVQPAVYTGPGTGVVLVSATEDEPFDDGNGLDHDRRDAGRDSARDREDDTGRRDDPKEKPEHSGDPHTESGLGEPVPGETAPVPDPPPWEPVDEGAGEHGSDDWPVDDYLLKATAEASAHALSGAWPDASRNLLHFLGNSGEPLEQDVNRILDEVPEFQEHVDTSRDNLGAQAIEEARNSGATGPVTFPINTQWEGFGYGDTKYEDQNWFYASGGWQYNLTGQVTAYPPSEPGGEWRYETTTRVNWRDQYNWDGGKKTPIGPFEVTDESLAEMHRAGVAQEYPMYGQSDEYTSEGTG